MRVVLLISLLVLAACAQQAPQVNTPGDVATSPSPEPVVQSSPADDGATSADVLRGYIPYEDALFEQATREGTLVYLEFFAPWCPYCRALDPLISSTFDELKAEGVAVVGFKVDYDARTDLRKKYGVTYQHTHIVIKDGAVVHKSLAADLTKDELKQIILSFA